MVKARSNIDNFLLSELSLKTSAGESSSPWAISLISILLSSFKASDGILKEYWSLVGLIVRDVISLLLIKMSIGLSE